MTQHAIEITTRDGRRVSFTCPEDQSLLAAAEAAGIALPALCREGGCGACLATCTGGDYRLGEHNPAALPAASGATLLCRTYPRSSMTLTAPYDYARIRFQALSPRPAQIVALERVAHRTRRLLLHLPPEDGGSLAAEFEPGQCMALAVPGRGLSRPYSLANAPNFEGELEFLIRLQPGGRFSAYLEQDARPGQYLEVVGPSGSFGLDGRSPRPRCFVAGGTGLSPFLSMLRRAAEWGEDHPTRLYFGVNREEELFLIAELERLGRCLPGLKVTLCVAQPGAAWDGFRGTAVAALRADLARGMPAMDLYLCGPPGMVEAATAVAGEFGIPPERLISERFVASA